MSWIWPHYINPDLALSGRERRAIHRHAWMLWWADKRNVVIYLALPAGYLFCLTVASDIGGRLATFLGLGELAHRLMRAASPFLLFIACFVLGGALLQRYRFAPCVYRALRLHGYDVCPRCGYWLKGLADDTDRCPECGAEREAAPAAPSP